MSLGKQPLGGGSAAPCPECPECPDTPECPECPECPAPIITLPLSSDLPDYLDTSPALVTLEEYV
jgi:hypothetical protein